MKRLVALFLAVALGACSTPRLEVPRPPDGKEVRYHHEPASLWRRFLSTVLGAFAPEDLL